jgi:hypothetical protein
MYGTLGLFLEPKRDISKRDEREQRDIRELFLPITETKVV